MSPLTAERVRGLVGGPVRDLEVPVASLTRYIAPLDRLDAGHAWALMEPTLETGQRLGIGLRDKLDGAILAIPNAPGHAARRRLAHRGVAEVHALDGTADDEARSRRHGAGRRLRLASIASSPSVFTTDAAVAHPRR